MIFPILTLVRCSQFRTGMSIDLSSVNFPSQNVKTLAEKIWFSISKAGAFQWRISLPEEQKWKAPLYDSTFRLDTEHLQIPKTHGTSCPRICPVDPPSGFTGHCRNSRARGGTWKGLNGSSFTISPIRCWMGLQS